MKSARKYLSPDTALTQAKASSISPAINSPPPIAQASQVADITKGTPAFA